jgi:methyl-coenzyme M reductase gamma subunit
MRINMKYTPQFYPGRTSVGINRRKHMSANLEMLRDIAEADVVMIMGHRAPGADYPSIHPPLKEMGEPDCPIRQIVKPTPGAAAGDRIRYSQFTDSMYFAPATPYWRSYWAAINCRGCDPGTLSGRQIMEARERDIEAYTKKTMDSEMFDPALSGMRGCAVHGHSLRLQDNGMMFDMLARTEMGKDGNVYQVKNQVGIPLDKRINIGKPMSEAEAKKRTTIFRVDGVPIGGKVGARKYDEAIEALHHMWELRSKWGYRPE